MAVLQDWEKGRRAELDAFSGYIVSKQRESGVATPVNEMILAIAERIERGELVQNISNAELMIRGYADIIARD